MEQKVEESAFIPIGRDDLSFKDRQQATFTDMQRNMEEEMEKRRRDWEREVERMQEEFFRLKPQEKGHSTSNTLDLPTAAVPNPVGKAEIIDVNNMKTIYSDTPEGGRKFRIRFDVRDFESSEIKVRAEGHGLTVHAQHFDDISGFTREFKRTVQIPENVDPDKMKSYLSADGILTVEAPVPPEYCSLPAPSNSNTGNGHGSRVTSSPSTILSASPSVFLSASPSTHLSPRVSSPRLSPRVSSRRLNNPVILDTNHGKQFKMMVEIGTDYEPEDVSVKFYGKKIVVHAKHEENKGGMVAKREFSREFDVPENIDPQTLKSVFTKDGKLTVVASLKGNINPDDAIQAVLKDLPMDGRPCTINY